MFLQHITISLHHSLHHIAFLSCQEHHQRDSSSFILDVQITYSDKDSVVSVMIDSKLAGNFIDYGTVIKLQLLLCSLNNPLKISIINSSTIRKGSIPLFSAWIQMQISSLHYETIYLLVTDTSGHLIILGIPWLHMPNPQISWSKYKITRWSDYCKENCLQCPQITNLLTFIKNPETPVTVSIPEEYKDFMYVFSKARVSGFPPYRPYNCAKDHSRIYPLSCMQQSAMEKYVQEALKQGYIEPATSPASARFFCIAYWGLNRITGR